MTLAIAATGAGGLISLLRVMAIYCGSRDRLIIKHFIVKCRLTFQHSSNIVLTQQTYESLTDILYERMRNWETGHYNSVLEIKVSFLGIHKWEPDIYI